MMISAAIGAALLFGAGGAWAAVEKRVALVIGNDGYTKAPHLNNPKFDAEAIAAKLRNLGFDVSVGYDLNEVQLRSAVGEFSAKAQFAQASVVYFAGHGVANSEDNYLLPVDMDLKRAGDLDLHALSLSQVLKQMKNDDNAEGVKVVILDACRDNPFAKEMSVGSGRAVPVLRGLAPADVASASGTLIVYATGPNTSAIDGAPGQHSPFAEALLEHMDDANTTIDDVMKRVRKSVYAETNHAQLPWLNSSLTGEFTLNPVGGPAQPAPVVVAPPPVVPPAIANNPEPVSPSADPDQALRNEVGDIPGEKALNLSDADVKRIQRRLAVLKTYHGAATGTLDDASRTAIVAWQQKRGVKAATGNLGPLQLQALLTAKPIPPNEAELKSETGTPASQKALALSPDEVRELQIRLNLLGLLKASNGLLDRTMSEAVAVWQARAGLTATGSLGPLQVDALRAQTEDAYEQRMAAADPAPALPSRVLQQAAPVGHHVAQQRVAGVRPTGNGFTDFVGTIVKKGAEGVTNGLFNKAFR